MLAVPILLPAAQLRRLENAYRSALGVRARLSMRLGALLATSPPGTDEADAGLGLLRALAGLPDTRGSITTPGNPYHRLVSELPAAALRDGAPAHEEAALLRAMRPVLVTVFAYAVPTDAVLDRIITAAAGGTIVEVGAGGGYWARCLADRGALIAAFDRVLPVDQMRPGGRLYQHHPVAVGGPAEALAEALPTDTLLLCWPPGLINRDAAAAGAPPVFSPMGMEALDRFRGRRLIFIGDHIASFGSPAFFDRLDREFELEARMPLPNLGTWRDSASFYLRKSIVG